ncbi:MAG: tyrosine-type recombinase/integrase [Acidobacteria bacterium]|nr:tyrosine-type recombinase/integrase [Acidobacteriota bacterium]
MSPRPNVRRQTEVCRRKLTKIEVERIRKAAKTSPPEDHDFVWDTEVRGFGLRITKTGVLAYVYQYRTRGGIPRRVTIGKHGSPWTPDSARGEAKRLGGLVNNGADPAAERDAAREIPTLKEFAERYLTEHAEPKKKASSVYTDRLMLRLHILPVLGRKRMTDITTADVTRWHVALGKKRTVEVPVTARTEGREAGKRDMVRGGPYIANRALILVTTMFNLAEKWGVIPRGSSPAYRIEKFKEQARERLLTAEEFARLGKVLTEMRASGEAPAVGLDAITFLLLSGCRLNEALTMKWSYVKKDRGVIELPDTKTGARILTPGAAAFEVLDGLERVDGNDYVFPGARNGRKQKENTHFVGVPHIWNTVRVAAGIPDVRIHDLRHAFGSVAVLGSGIRLTQSLLGHASIRTTERYSHVINDPVRAAADKAASEIAAMLRRGVDVRRRGPECGAGPR